MVRVVVVRGAWRVRRAKIYGNLGITGTPVIDPVSKTLYVVGATSEGGSPIFGCMPSTWPRGGEIWRPGDHYGQRHRAAADGVGGIVTFAPLNHNQRPGLLLLNGIVYVSFGAYNELEESAWHGWIVGYDAGSLAQTGVFCTTPNGNAGGVWMSGIGLAADRLDPVNYPYGRMFVATGNGDFTAAIPYGSNMNYGDSVVDLDLTGGMPSGYGRFHAQHSSHARGR